MTPALAPKQAGRLDGLDHHFSIGIAGGEGVVVGEDHGFSAVVTELRFGGSRGWAAVCGAGGRIERVTCEPVGAADALPKRSIWPICLPKPDEPLGRY